MDTLLLVALLLLAALAGLGVGISVQRTRSVRGPDAPERSAPTVVEPAPEHVREPALEPVREAAPVREPALDRVSEDAVELRVVIRPARPAPAPVVVTRLSDLAAGAPPLADDAVVLTGPEDGPLVVSGAAPHATGAVASLLLARLGDRPVMRVAPPGRHDVTDASGAVVGTAVHEPLAGIVAALPRSSPSGDAVLLVEHAERHLRRGLDRVALRSIRAANPSLLVVLVVGDAPEGGAVDDASQWLRGLMGGALPRIGPAADDPDADLDVALAAVAQRSPLAVDVIEAVAHAVAAGRLPEVPVGPVLRLAAGLAGGDPDAPVAPAALVEALDVVDACGGAERPLIRCGGTGADGLPTTLAVDPLLVARCVEGVTALGGPLLAVLMDDTADDVELLDVARVLVGADDPRPAMTALDRLVDRSERVREEARLLRGVVGDRVGSSRAVDDYLAVAAGADRDLAVHARFLVGGLLEAEGDVDAARDAYTAVVATDHPVHGPMAAFNLAWLDERSGDGDRAADAYRTLAGGEHPDAAPMAALNLAALLQRGKRFAEAESWYRAAVDSRHADAAPMAAVALGLMLERRQRPREAKALFRYAASTGHEEAAPAALRRLGAPRR